MIAASTTSAVRAFATGASWAWRILKPRFRCLIALGHGVTATDRRGVRLGEEAPLVARPNSRDMYEVFEVPHLRIVDDALWIRVKARQELIRAKLTSNNPSTAAERYNLNASHRPRFLLSGLLRCGCCGGGYTIVAKDRYGCAVRRQKGICENSRTITREELEARVLDGLKERLLAPDLVEEFVREFNAEIERNRTLARDRSAAYGRKLANTERKINSMLKAIEDGMYHPSMKERMLELEGERAALMAEMEPSEAANVDVLMHPNLPELYRRKVSELERLLEDGAERDDARGVIRSMIDRVVLTPRKAATGLEATLYGEIAAILAVCERASSNTAPVTETSSQLSVVAGVGFEPMTFGDYRCKRDNRRIFILKVNRLTRLKLQILHQCCNVYGGRRAIHASVTKFTHDFSLPCLIYFSIAGQGRQRTLVPQVLAPDLELFGVSTDLLAQQA